MTVQNATISFKKAGIIMKRNLALLLSLVLCLTCVSPLSASATEIGSTEPMPKFTVIGDGIRLISVEYIPDDCENSIIPDEVMEKFTCDPVQNDIIPYGTSIPSGSSIHDLSKGKYSFGIETESLYYSDYVFTGHGGSVTMNIKESCGLATDAEFLVRVFVRSWLGAGTVVGQVAVKRNNSGTLTVDDLSESSKVYFTISPEEQGLVDLSSLYNYIKKG